MRLASERLSRFVHITGGGSSNVVSNWPTSTPPSPFATVTVHNLTSGSWVALVDGFTVHGKKDNYRLRLAVDGTVLN
ncbi:MAG: hypothetical protein GY953_51530 [bacterium]|nr:hypothetical protein [bacterium]